MVSIHPNPLSLSAEDRRQCQTGTLTRQSMHLSTHCHRGLCKSCLGLKRTLSACSPFCIMEGREGHSAILPLHPTPPQLKSSHPHPHLNPTQWKVPSAFHRVLPWDNTVVLPSETLGTWCSVLGLQRGVRRHNVRHSGMSTKEELVGLREHGVWAAALMEILGRDNDME